MRFDRAYSLIVGPGGGTGVEIDNLRLTFEISKDDRKKPNRSQIEIYNLAPDRRAALEKPDTRCVLKAGYWEEEGPLEVYRGDVVFAWTAYDGPDVITTLELGEGNATYRDSVITKGYPAGITAHQVLRDLAKQMGLTLSLPDDAPNRSWSGGLSLHGSARSALDKVTAAAGLSWSIQGGTLQVIRRGGNTNRTVFDLAADSGLIGSPERQRQGRQAAAQVTDQATNRPRRVQAESGFDGWRVKSLLLPTLLPGDRVKLSARGVDGVLTIKDLRHIGDTHDGDWITELRLVDPSKAEADKRNERPRSQTQNRQSNAGGTR
jgi:hypothetical protein